MKYHDVIPAASLRFLAAATHWERDDTDRLSGTALSFRGKLDTIRRMSTISTILEADADGTLHLPLPAELRHGRIKVEAQLEPIPGESSGAAEMERQRRLRAVMERIRERNPFKDIADPVVWQRTMREDVELPSRE